jgi:hypothetical protein
MPIVIGAAIDPPANVVNIFGDTIIDVMAVANLTATADPGAPLPKSVLRAAGYLLVDDFGADPLGQVDSIIAINNCLDQARIEEKPVMFSWGGIYLVSDSIRAFSWSTNGIVGPFAPTHPLQLFGGGRDANRPVIRLMAGASNFQNVNDPHPIFTFRHFQNHNPATDGSMPQPADVMDDTGAAQSQANNLFYTTLQNFRIDCNGQPGAMGVYFPAAQRCFAADIEIDATGAAVGWEGLLGRNATATNIKIIGGKEQIRCSGRLSADGSNGMNVAGLTLVADADTDVGILGQTDAVPLIVVGFEFIENGFTGDWVRTQNATASARGCIALVDGIVRAQGGRVLDNSVGKSVYIRRVHVTGTDDLVKSGAQATVTGTGTWKLINEYTYIDQSGISAGSAEYPREVLVDGAFLTQPEPLTDIDSDTLAPTTDYVFSHVIDIHRLDDGRDYVDVSDFGVTPYTGSFSTNFLYGNGNIDVSEPDALSAYEAAIAAAAAAGHNRVFAPRGTLFISDTLDLLPHTKLFGTSAFHTKIGQKDSWQPTTDVYTVRTANDVNGTCQWSEMSVALRRWDPNTPVAAPPALFDNHNWMHWRTGKFSSSIQRVLPREKGLAENFTGNHNCHYFTDNGGGRHYGFTDDEGRAYYSVDAIGLRIENTTGQPLHIYGYNPEMGK